MYFYKSKFYKKFINFFINFWDIDNDNFYF